MTESPILSEISEAVLSITLARPEKKNAITSEMYELLIDALERSRDPAIGAVLIQGCGGVFTAGNDISDFLTQPDAFQDAAAFRFIRALISCPSPIVAAVEGDAIGIGLTMLLHCDLVYAAPSARFWAPFVELGLVPEAGSSLLLPRRVGPIRASEIFLLGDSIDAATARHLSLVNDIVEGGELAATALRQARRLALKPRQALRATRALLRGDVNETIAQAEEEARIFSKLLQSDAAREAFASFMKRRDPRP